MINEEVKVVSGGIKIGLWILVFLLLALTDILYSCYKETAENEEKKTSNASEDLNIYIHSSAEESLIERIAFYAREIESSQSAEENLKMYLCLLNNINPAGQNKSPGR